MQSIFCSAARRATAREQDPRVQQREEADLGAEMARIGGDGAESVSCRSEQEAVAERSVNIADIDGEQSRPCAV